MSEFYINISTGKTTKLLIIHYCDVLKWARKRLKSPAWRLFTQPFIKFMHRSKKTSKLRVTGLCDKRASNTENVFHLMTSSCATWDLIGFYLQAKPQEFRNKGIRLFRQHTTGFQLVWFTACTTFSSILTTFDPLQYKKIITQLLRCALLFFVVDGCLTT